MILPESVHALIVGLVLVALFITFVREWVEPDVAVVAAVMTSAVAVAASSSPLLSLLMSQRQRHYRSVLRGITSQPR